VFAWLGGWTTLTGRGIQENPGYFREMEIFFILIALTILQVYKYIKMHMNEQ
jgi:hypothetical protein